MMIQLFLQVSAAQVSCPEFLVGALVVVQFLSWN